MSFRYIEMQDPNRVRTAQEACDLARIFSKLGNKRDEERAIKRALKLDKKYPPAWEALGFFEGQRGKNKQAVEAFRKLVELDPTYRFGWFNLGIFLERMGQMDEAAKALDEELKVNPENGMAWCKKAEELYKEGQLEKAEEYVSRGIRLAPRCIEGQELLRKLQRERALKPKKTVDERIRLAEMHHSSLEIEQARRECEEALKQDPSHSRGNYVYGHVLLDLGEYEDAVEAFEKSVKSDADNPAAWLKLATASELSHDRIDAIDILKTAVEKFPNDQFLWREYGRIQARHSEWDGARSAFQRVIEINDNDKDVYQLLSMIPQEGQSSSGVFEFKIMHSVAQGLQQTPWVLPIGSTIRDLIRSFEQILRIQHRKAPINIVVTSGLKGQLSLDSLVIPNDMITLL
jgi:tetratricopeptide (TPR) repeat protein